jgi:hypothetical protein
MRPDNPPALSRTERTHEENLPLGHSFGKDSSYMRNVFVEKWPTLVKALLVAGAGLFVMIRWA